MGDRDKGSDLPQPGLEELEGSADDGKEASTEGPGNVSVDEPTEPALSGADDDSWTDAPDKRDADSEDDDED